MDKLREYIIKQRPILDANNKFAFFANAKVAQKSIAWGVVKRRCIMKNHGGRNYRKFLHTRDFNNMFKFTIVRNPFDRVVSAFHYLQEHHPETISADENFRDFIKTRFRKDGVEIDRHFHHQHPNILFNGNIFVDYVGRFENLKADWKMIASKIDCSPRLPHTNKSKHKPFGEYYEDKECFEIVSKIYEKDIKLLGYSYKEGK